LGEETRLTRKRKTRSIAKSGNREVRPASGPEWWVPGSVPAVWGLSPTFGRCVLVFQATLCNTPADQVGRAGGERGQGWALDVTTRQPQQRLCWRQCVSHHCSDVWPDSDASDTRYERPGSCLSLLRGGHVEISGWGSGVVPTEREPPSLFCKRRESGYERGRPLVS